jgi:Lrp/AsnC family transcriptional regulator for asnA, asnC and gidA
VNQVPIDLDDVDRKILNALQSNGRVAFSEIANEIGVDEATIRYRVKKLKVAGVITKFTALLDPAKIGFPVTAVIMIKINPVLFDSASAEIAKLSETRHVFQSTGGYDVVAVVNTRDLGHLSDLRRRLEFISGVSDVMVFATTKLLKIKPSFDL